jgi:DNA invertase Pin-like site-specific DNA recombinase
MIAWAYCRKSNDEGDASEDARSCKRQLARAKEYAAKQGWTFDPAGAFEDENVSGARLNRPGLQRLLAALKGKRRLGVLIVSEESRLGRFEDERELSALTLEINKTGAKIVGYLDGQEIGRGAVSMFKGLAATEERRRGSQRTRDGLRNVAQCGFWPGGKAYGFRSSGGHAVTVKGRVKVVDRTLIVDKREAKVVVLIYELRVNKGWGHRMIANHLTGLKIPAPRAGSWTTAKDVSVAGGLVKVRARAEWGAAQVGNILKSPLYDGRRIWGRAAEPVEFAVPRVVPAKLWAAAQRVNKAASDKTWRRPGGQLLSRPAGKHWATRFIRCGICDGPMVVRWGRGKDPEKGYLFCSRHWHWHDRCANGQRLSVVKAEAAIVEKFEEALKSQVVISKVEAWVKSRREAKAMGKGDRRALEQERDRLEREIQKLVDGLATVGASAEIKRGIEDRKAKLEHVDGQLKGASVLMDFDARTLADAVEAVTEDWRRQLKRNPDVVGQVLGKLLPIKMAAAPRRDGKGWDFEAECDYAGVLREADEELLEALQALSREHGIKPVKGNKTG